MSVGAAVGFAECHDGAPIAADLNVDVVAGEHRRSGIAVVPNVIPRAHTIAVVRQFRVGPAHWGHDSAGNVLGKHKQAAAKANSMPAGREGASQVVFIGRFILGSPRCS